MAKTKYTVESICEWIRLHDLINVTKLERKCDIPHGSIANALAGKTERLSEKHLPKLIELLRDYGFNVGGAKRKLVCPRCKSGEGNFTRNGNHIWCRKCDYEFNVG